MAKLDKINLNGIQYELSDSSIAQWARATTKPTYTASEVGAIGTINAVAGGNIGSVGTPSVTAATNGNTTTLTFNYLKGAKGDKGDDGTGVNIKGTLENENTLPTTGVSGDAYLINGNLYVYVGSGGNVTGHTQWSNVGNIKGPKGDNGVTPTVTATATVDNNTGTPSVTVTNTGTSTNPNFKFDFKNLKGANGSSATSVSWSNVTGAPNFITATDVADNYLPLSGGKIESNNIIPLQIKSSHASNNSSLLLQNNINSGSITVSSDALSFYYSKTNKRLSLRDDISFEDDDNTYIIYHEGNFTPSEYAKKENETVSNFNINNVTLKGVSNISDTVNLTQNVLITKQVSETESRYVLLNDPTNDNALIFGDDKDLTVLRGKSVILQNKTGQWDFTVKEQKVGVGTLNPTEKLEVRGYVKSANGFKIDGGTSNQFLKADGSVDNNIYLKEHQSLDNYLPLTGGTLKKTNSPSPLNISSGEKDKSPTVGFMENDIFCGTLSVGNNGFTILADDVMNNVGCILDGSKDGLVFSPTLQIKDGKKVLLEGDSIDSLNMIEIENSVDLNDLKPEKYTIYCLKTSSFYTTVKNNPQSTAIPFSLTVFPFKVGNNTYYVQEHINVYGTINTRYYYNNAWSKWVEIATTVSSVKSSEMLKATRLTNENLNDVTVNGGMNFFVSSDGNTCSNKPDGVDGFSIVVFNSSNSNVNLTQVITSTSGVQYKRTKVDNTIGWGNWKKILDEDDVPPTLPTKSFNGTYTITKDELLKALRLGKFNFKLTYSTYIEATNIELELNVPSSFNIGANNIIFSKIIKMGSNERKITLSINFIVESDHSITNIGATLSNVVL